MNIVKASAFVPKKREKSLLNHSPMMAGHSVQKVEKSEKKTKNHDFLISVLHSGIFHSKKFPSKS